MTTQARNFLCCCCGKGSAASSNDQFPLGKNQTYASMGVQTDSFKCRSYCQQEDQAENQQYYPQDYPQDYQDYSQDYSHEYVDPCAEYYSNQHGSEPEYRPHDGPIDSSNKYYNDSSKYQSDPLLRRNDNYGERGYQKTDEMRCRYDPQSSRFINDDAEDGYQNEVTRDDHDDLTGKASRNEKAVNGHGGSRKGSHHPRHKRGGGSGPTGLKETATIMRYNQPSWFPNRGRFSSNSRAFPALPYFRSRSGSDPTGNGRELGRGIPGSFRQDLDPAGNGHELGRGIPGSLRQDLDPAGDGYDLDQGNHYRSFRRRATDPGNLHSQSLMETGDMRRRNLSPPFPRPPVTTYAMPQASFSENFFNPLPSDSSRDIWHNNNNPQAYLFGWGQKKSTTKTGVGTNKLKMLYQINKAGVTCNCGQRLQFNLSVEENEGRCIACFEELRQDFADLLDLYKEMGYAPCECKGRISVSDLANEYLMDQANNASGPGCFENVGAPRKNGPVKTIELTPTAGFTGCMCREIKMEMFRKPSDLLSCQCDSARPNIVLRPPSDYNDDFDDEKDEQEPFLEDEPEPEEELVDTDSDMLSEPESEIYNASNPASRSNSSLKTPTILSSAEIVYSVDTRGSTSSAFIERPGRKTVATTSGYKQSTSSNTASYETAPSDSSIQSNRTFIISSPK